MSDQQISNYLREFHSDNISEVRNGSILEDEVRNYSILVDLKNLAKENSKLYQSVIENCHRESVRWTDIFHHIQLNDSSFPNHGKLNQDRYNVRFFNAAMKSEEFPVFNNISDKQFLTFRAKVVKAISPKFVDTIKDLYCSKCRSTIQIRAKYEYSYIFEKVKSCPTEFCKGLLYEKAKDENDVNVGNCISFQQMMVDPQMKSLNFTGNLLVTLEEDLCDIVAPGDSVVICGTAERMWKPNEIEVKFAIRVMSILREDVKPRSKLSIEEHSILVRSEWDEFKQLHSELELRDEIIASIAPKLKGLYPLKLAIALILCSATNKGEAGKASFTRQNSHILLVGDPGLGKSQLLQSAADISVRSVRTTGMGSTKAGLTAAAVRENGEWHLEAGALVLADGGICCIDEFNLMKNNDNVSIHEAMEQQTVSVSKAGIVCKLNSRCSIVASMNPKNPAPCRPGKDDTRGLTFAEIGLSGALVSRFDLIFLLEEQDDIEWEMEIADHIFEECLNQKSEIPGNLWDLEKLQAHFLVSQNTEVTISKEANEILCEYYGLYRQCSIRDPSRTSVRFLESLQRLTSAHAKLLLRSEADILDAITAIRLMESSFGFDQLECKFDLIKEKLPIGPSKGQMIEILERMQLFKFVPLIREAKPTGELNTADKKTQPPVPRFRDFGPIFDINRIEDSDEEVDPVAVARAQESVDLSFGGTPQASSSRLSLNTNTKSGLYNTGTSNSSKGPAAKRSKPEINSLTGKPYTQAEKDYLKADNIDRDDFMEGFLTICGVDIYKPFNLDEELATEISAKNSSTVEKTDSKYDGFASRPKTWNEVCSQIPYREGVGKVQEAKSSAKEQAIPGTSGRNPLKSLEPGTSGQFGAKAGTSGQFGGKSGNSGQFGPKPGNSGQLGGKAGIFDKHQRNLGKSGGNSGKTSKKPSKIDEIYDKNKMADRNLQPLMSFNENSIKNFDALKNFYQSEGNARFSQCLRDVEAGRAVADEGAGNLDNYSSEVVENSIGNTTGDPGMEIDSEDEEYNPYRIVIPPTSPKPIDNDKKHEVEVKEQQIQEKEQPIPGFKTKLSRFRCVEPEESMESEEQKENIRKSPEKRKKTPADDEAFLESIKIPTMEELMKQLDEFS